MMLQPSRHVTGMAMALSFLVLIVFMQSAAFLGFIAAVETWIEPGLFVRVAQVLDWPIGIVLFAALTFLFMAMRRNMALIAVTFLATGFIFGLEAFQWLGMA